MCVEDRKIAEQAIEQALELLRSGFGTPYNRNKARKTVRNELIFLQEEHPDSYIHMSDISDVDLSPEVCVK